MINEQKALSMVESIEYIGDEEEKDKETKAFMKKFVSMKADKAKELREKMEALDLLKIKPEHISKIIDLLPDSKDEINKIFVDVTLDEDETNKILEIVKEFK